MRLSTPGIVIRDYKYEQNRILTVLTQEQGVMTAFANNANRVKSALAGSTELLCYSDFVFFQTKNRCIVDHADSIRLFFGIRSRYEDLALASYFCQLFGELSPTGEPAPSQVQLLLGCLHYLENQKRPPLQLKAIAELRLLTLSGYMPNLVGCRVCDAYTSNKMYFTPTGELICSNCIEQSDLTGCVTLPDGVLAAMRHIIYADSKKIFSFTLSEKGLKTLARTSEQYLLYQLEKTLPTLEFFRGLT